jgi:peptide chain release factor 1
VEPSERLAEIEARYERVQAEMASPEVAREPDRLRRLGKEFAELSEVVLPYRAYRESIAHAEEARAMAEGEADPEMAAFLREEADTAAAKAAELRGRLEELLVPKDPNEGKDVLVEIRAGAGGQEAALWAGELFEMYRHLAERRRWKTEVLSAPPRTSVGSRRRSGTAGKAPTRD